MTPRKAVRVRKARRSGLCPLCNRWILAGQRIASVRGGPFGCLDHVTPQDTERKDSTMKFSVIDTESMRHGTVSVWTPEGRVSRPDYDMRRTPVGPKAERWEWDRMVYPGRTQTGRRVREYITVMYCREGWWGSGTADAPHPETCSTLLDPQWRSEYGGLDSEKFSAHHDTWPVTWVVKVKRHRNVRRLCYCDPELPDEYRPDPDADPMQTP